MSTFWVTRYALTQGIWSEDNCTLRSISGTPYVMRGRPGSPDYLFLHLGREAFDNEQLARLDAIQRAERKLKSLDRQRAKLLRYMAVWKAP